MDSIKCAKLAGAARFIPQAIAKEKATTRAVPDGKQVEFTGAGKKAVAIWGPTSSDTLSERCLADGFDVHYQSISLAGPAENNVMFISPVSNRTVILLKK